MTKLIPEEIRIQQINERKNITFLRWDGTYCGNKSKATISCDVCSFIWSANVNNLLSSKSGCPQCSGRRAWTGDDRIVQINKIYGVEFVEWPNKYTGVDSKATVRCLIDGFEWSASVSNLVNHGTGCPKCKSLAISKTRRTNKDELELQIKLSGSSKYEFVRWENDSNAQFRAKAIVRCLFDGFEWAAKASNLIKSGTGCPKCSRTGFDPSRAGTLYALRSECGRYIKVGISNNPTDRLSELKRVTPFGFDTIEQIHGNGVMIASLERHFHKSHNRADLSGFSGATEWLISTGELIQELRNTRDSLHQGV